MLTLAARLRVRSLTIAMVVILLAGLMPATIGAAAPSSAPTITGPSAGALVGANPTLSWKALSGAVKYRVQVSPSAVFATTVVNVDTVNIRYIPPVDLPLGTLYWRVAGMDASSNLGPYADSSFEKAWAVAPTLTTPADLATLSFPGNPPVFTWSPLSGAKTYTLEIDDDPAFLSPTTYTTPNTSYALTVPQTIGQPWHWRVRGTSATSGVVSPWSEERSYSLSWASAPTLTSPPNTTLTSIEDVNLVWQPVLGAATYDLQVSPNGDWANNLVIDQTGVRGTRYSPATTLDNGSYFWRVRSRDASGNIGSWSAEWQFARGWSDRPTLTAPAWSPSDPLTIPNVAVPTLSWTPIDHASWYEIQVGTDVNFSPGTYSNCYTNHTTWTPYAGGSGAPGGCGINLGIGTLYYWRVRGIDSPRGVLGLWSSTGPDDTFRFIWRPDIPDLLSPSDGATVSTPVLSWQPAGDMAQYKVTILKADLSVASTAATYGLTYTPTTALVPTDGPFKWYVQTIDGNGVTGLIPASIDWWSFSLTVPTTTTSFDLLTPTDGSSHIRMPSMTWQPYTGASYYKVRYGVAGSGIVNGTPLSGGSKLPYAAFTPTGLPLSAGTYFWYVEAYDAGNVLLAESAEATFVITPPDVVGSGSYTSPERCTPLQVCDKIADTPSLDWVSTPLAGAYLVYLSIDPEFTNIYRTYKTVFTHLAPRESYLDNQAGQAYYWFVRPCVDYAGSRCGPGPDTSANANAGAFQKRSAAAVLSTPANDANVANLVRFTWQDYLDTNGGLTPAVTQEARQYNIQVSTVADFSSLLDTATVDQTTYTPWNKTYPEGPLYWRVQAIDGSGNPQTWSVQRTLTKASPAVGQTSPGNGANVTGVPTLKWSAQAYAARYTVEIYKNGDTDVGPGGELLFSPVNRILTQITPMAAWTPTTSIPAGTYAWRVRRLDASSLPGPWSAGRTFRLQVAAPTLNSPSDGAVFRNDLLLFSWTAVAGAVQYKWELSTSPTFTTLTASELTVRNSWAPTIKFGDGKYYWRVKVLDAGGNTLSTSSSRSFTKDTVRPTVTAKAPTTSASITGPFTATFSENVKGVSTTTFKMVIAGTATAIAGTVTPSSSTSTTTAKFTPTSPLVPGQSYALSLTSGIKDLAGNTLVPTSWTVRTSLIVESTSPALIESWDRDTNASASGGGYVAARTAGMKLAFTFTGTNVTLVGRRAADAGKADIYLDGVKQSTVDFYSAAVQWQTTAWSKSGLANAKHTLEVRALGTKRAAATNTWVYVDAFKVGAATTQETGGAVRASFPRVSAVPASGGSYDRVLHDSAGDTGSRPAFTMTFVGTGVSVYATKRSDGGAVDIYVDGVLRGNDVSLYAASTVYKQNILTSPTLVMGVHTIKIEATGLKPAGSTGTWVDVDYLTIQ